MQSSEAEATKVIEALCAWRRPSLEELTLTITSRVFWDTRAADVAPLADALALRALLLRSGSVSMTRALPTLERLRVETKSLQKREIDVIASSLWPTLESLELWTGPGADAQALRRLLRSPCFPALRALEISNCDRLDDLCSVLEESPLVPQLRSLTLAMGTMTGRGARALIRAAKRLEHLALDVSQNTIDSESAKALSEALPTVDVAGQRAEDERGCTTNEVRSRAP